jgi:hypothetical protein
MSVYVAFLNPNNVVTQVVQSPDDGQDWCAIWMERQSCTCITTTKDGSTRNKYAQVGDIYHVGLDAFIGPSPYLSWVLDGVSWVAPTPRPDDGLVYGWDELTTSWVELTGPE